MKKEMVTDNRFGLVAFVLGLSSFVFFWALFIPSLVMGLTGIIFAILQLRKGKNNLAIAGLVLSIIGFIIALVILIKVAAFFSLFISCQQNPSSGACEKMAARMGIDDATMACMSNPNAPGCDEILAKFKVQAGAATPQ